MSICRGNLVHELISSLCTVSQKDDFDNFFDKDTVIIYHSNYTPSCILITLTESLKTGLPTHSPSG